MTRAVVAVFLAAALIPAAPAIRPFAVKLDDSVTLRQ
jgi:hypothetical protein